MGELSRRLSRRPPRRRVLAATFIGCRRERRRSDTGRMWRRFVRCSLDGHGLADPTTSLARGHWLSNPVNIYTHLMTTCPRMANCLQTYGTTPQAHGKRSTISSLIAAAAVAAFRRSYWRKSCPCGSF